MFFSRKPLIATHDGYFHPDDVCAVAVLHVLLNGRYKLIRTRDKKLIDSADYVVDVGGIHDPIRNRFDHHQKGGAGTRVNGAPFAAFGLVWKEYGEMISGSEAVARKIDEKIISLQDALDNGVEIHEKKTKGADPYLFADFLFSWSPVWNEKQDFDAGFRKALSYAVDMLLREIQRETEKEKGKKHVEEIYASAPDKRILILDAPYPWSDVLTSHPEPLFLIRQSENGEWGARAVPVSHEGFAVRKPFPEAWAGLSGIDLAKASGVSDAVFCHNGRFLSVAKSREGALALAEKALAL